MNTESPDRPDLNELIGDDERLDICEDTIRALRHERDREWCEQLGVEMEDEEQVRLLCADLRLMAKHLRDQCDENVGRIAMAGALRKAAADPYLAEGFERKTVVADWLNARAAQIENEEK